MPEKNNNLTESTDLTEIPGMNYLPDYISEDEHDNLLEIIYQQTWLEDLKRRVQHYEYKYDYKKRSVTPSMYLGKLPDWLLNIASRLYESRILRKLPDQVIINEYQPGQGIANHRDCPVCFEETITSLSLGSTCVMQFSHVTTREKSPILLHPKSLIVLQGPARYQWHHGIPARKIDKYGSREFVRTRRVSMTFRNILQPQNSLIGKLF